MDKPITMSVKDYLIKTQSLRTNTSPKIIEAVIENQFQEANKALTDNNSVELSGWGKFIFNTKKAKKKYQRYIIYLEETLKELEDTNLSPTRKKKLEFNLKIVENTLQILNQKINDFNSDFSNNRGVQKQTDSPIGVEECNKTSFNSEEKDL